MQANLADARQIAGLVAMPRLLTALGFEVNERTRRARCLLHGGSNPSAFSWTDDGRWFCFSCGRGGDRISLAREARQCGFREAMEFLAGLAGVGYRGRRVSPREIKQMRARRQRAEVAGWAIRDALRSFESKCGRALILVERLRWLIGEQLRATADDQASVALWEMLAGLAPVATCFLALWDFLGRASPEARIRFALASCAERRALVLGDCDAE